MKLFRLSSLLVTAFLALTLVGLALAAQLPPSKGAPQVGQTAPDFSLPDSNGKDVKLSDVLLDPSTAARRTGKNAPALLLVFYRGYW